MVDMVWVYPGRVGVYGVGVYPRGVDGYFSDSYSSLGLFLLKISLSRASWGALGSIWHEKREKKEKNMTFLDVFGPSWEAFWRPCGLQEAILAASWASWGRFWEPLGGFWEHFLVILLHMLHFRKH